MEILLVVPRYNLTNKKNYNYAFPIGLSYISAVLKKAGYNLDCLNLNHLDGKAKDILNKKLDSKKYDIVCTGSIAREYAVTEIILDTVHRHPSRAKTILGGPIISTEPEFMFNLLKPDFVVIGEGEKTIVELVRALQKNKDVSKVKGIMYLDKNGNIIRTPAGDIVKNLDSIPFPDYEGLGFRDYLDHLHSPMHYCMNLLDYPRSYPIMCSRSCPFNCTFCYHDTKYRKRSIKNIMKEIRSVVWKYNINIIFPHDECLAVDKSRLYELCKQIKKLRSELPWDLSWTAQMTVQDVTPELLKELKESGCTSISYGFESISPIVLKSMRKPATPEEIDKAFHYTLDAGIAIAANFIFGDVAETKETAKETLDYWKKNCLGQVGLLCIQPYPGSEIYKHCLRKGIIKDKLDFVKNKIGEAGKDRGVWLNMTDKMTDKELNDLRREVLDCMSKYSKFTVPKSIKKTGDKIYAIKIDCPFCKKEVEYKNLLIENKFSFGCFITCRKCFMRIWIVSNFQKIAYRYYPITRSLRNFQRNIKDLINRKRL